MMGYLNLKFCAATDGNMTDPAAVQDNDSLHYVLATMGMVTAASPAAPPQEPCNIQAESTLPAAPLREKIQMTSLVQETQPPFATVPSFYMDNSLVFMARLAAAALMSSAVLAVLLFVRGSSSRRVILFGEDAAPTSGLSLNISAAMAATNVSFLSPAVPFSSPGVMMMRLVSWRDKGDNTEEDGELQLRVVYILDAYHLVLDRCKKKQCTGGSQHSSRSKEIVSMLATALAEANVSLSSARVLASAADPLLLPWKNPVAQFVELQVFYLLLVSISMTIFQKVTIRDDWQSGKSPEEWHLQEFKDALNRTCKEVERSRLASLAGRISMLDDVLVPSRLCKKVVQKQGKGVTLGGIVRYELILSYDCNKLCAWNINCCSTYQ